MDINSINGGGGYSQSNSDSNYLNDVMSLLDHICNEAEEDPSRVSEASSLSNKIESSIIGLEEINTTSNIFLKV